MKVIESAQQMRAERAAMAGKVAVVPTMGALHAGHLSLVDIARERAPNVIGTLFVNPAQFGPNEDLTKYPRPRERDLEQFERAGAGWVFAPPLSEMYVAGESTRVDPGAIGTVLEGAYRPGHFAGVATVVTKLLALLRPDFAVFGEKDAQQVRVIRRINRDLMLGAEIVVGPTVREPDGLAMSSRNVFLQGPDRAAAAVLFRALKSAEAAWKKGERRGPDLRRVMQAVLAAEPRASVDYVSVADPETLAELGISTGPALASLAVRIDGTRLIDNITLRP